MNLESLQTLSSFMVFLSFTSWVTIFGIFYCAIVQVVAVLKLLTKTLEDAQHIWKHVQYGGEVHYIFFWAKFCFWVGDDVPLQYFRSFQGEQMLAYWDADLIPSLWLLKSLKQFQQRAFLTSKFGQISLQLSVYALWWRRKWTYAKTNSIQPHST